MSSAGPGRPFIVPPTWAARGHGLAAVKNEERLLNVGPQGEIDDQPSGGFGGFPVFAVNDSGVYRVVAAPGIPMAAGSHKRQRLAAAAAASAAAAAVAVGGGSRGGIGVGGDEDDDDVDDGRGDDDDNDDDVDINSDDGDDPPQEAPEIVTPPAPPIGLWRPFGGTTSSGILRRENEQNLPAAAGQHHGAERRFFYNTGSSPRDAVAAVVAAAATNAAAAAAAAAATGGGGGGGDGGLALAAISGSIANHLRTMDRARAAPPTRDRRPSNGNYPTPSEAGPSDPRLPVAAVLAKPVTPRPAPPHGDDRTVRASSPPAKPKTMSFLSLLSELSPEFSMAPPPERSPVGGMEPLRLSETRGPETEAARRWRMVSTLPKCFREYYHRIHSS